MLRVYLKYTSHTVFSVSLHFRLNLKIKKSTLCCCFTWIVFIELNSPVAFLLIKENLRWFAGKVGGWGILRNGEGILVMGGNDSEMGGLIPLYGLCISWRGLWIELQWGGGLAQVGDKAQRWESLKVWGHHVFCRDTLI